MEDLKNIQLNIEQDFWGDFVQEAFEHIEAIETNAITLEDNPSDMETIHTMFRAFHTIKGLAGFVEHTIIQELSHSTETMMNLCRNGALAVNKDIVDAILKSADFIKSMCNDMDCYKEEDFINGIVNHIEVLEKLSVVPEAQSEEQPKPEVGTQEQPQEQVELQVEQQQETQVVSPTEEDRNQELQDFANIDMSDIIKEDSQEPSESVLSEQEDFSQVQQDEQNTSQNQEEINQEQEASQEQKTLANVYDMQQQTIAPQKEEIKEEVKEKPKEAPKNEQKKNVNEEYMKVANSKVDYLVDMIGELIINQSLLERHIESKYSNDNALQSGFSSFSSITRELQYLSMALRMVSLKSTFLKITRIARDTIKDLNKDVEFVTSGEMTEIDRIVADKLLDPLVHLIKNAISHGCEVNVDDRIVAGKPRKARVELNAYNKRGKIFIEVKDDGRGIDTEVVYQKAMEKGIINPTHTYTDDEIKDFIFLPGFSTAKQVDNISGRGVGMDVVRTQILKIGGKVDISSEKGKGSTFTLEVPVNHAIMNGTVVDINSHHFIIPTINVKEIIQPEPSQWISTNNKTTMLQVREDIIPIIPHSVLFKGDEKFESLEAVDKPEQSSKLVILLELDQELRALPITNVINRQEIVVKPVGLEFTNLKYIAGMSILGNGQVSLILDIDYLFKKEAKE